MNNNLKNIVSKSSSILWMSIFCISSPLAFSEEIVSEENIWERTYLTNDWDGKRATLADRGVDIGLEYTSTYQGPVSEDGESSVGYGGKVDAFIDFDGEKLDAWRGAGFHVHLEYRHGDAENMFGGAVFPMNTALATVPLHQLEATSLHFSQKIGEDTNILLGKINALDLSASDPFFGGLGIHRFMNLAFVVPPSGVVPPVIMGTIITVKAQPVSWTFMLFSADNRRDYYSLKDILGEGVNISLGGNYASKLAGRKTSYKLTATYSSKYRTDLEAFYPTLEPSEIKGSFNVNFIFSHSLQEDYLGIYIKAAIADGNPNPIKSSILGGISGKAHFFSRSQDIFGIGSYFYNFSDEAHDALKPTMNFKDEAGFEAYYNYELTPWLHITGDIQYVNPADGDMDNLLVLGLRTNIKF